MILILGQNGPDSTTENVIDWIRFLGGDWSRLNSEDLQNEGKFSYKLDSQGGKLSASSVSRSVDLEDVSVVWLRRWPKAQIHSLGSLQAHGPIYAALMNQSVREHNAVSKLLFSSLNHAKWVVPEESVQLRKIYVLQCAARAGLSVPPTLITSDKKELAEFKLQYDRIVLKPLTDCVAVPLRENLALMFTSEIGDDFLGTLPDRFFPSMVQELIPKQFEIRSFYLAGQFYSAALFSQYDPATAIDFRRYSEARPTRCVPYSLPAEVSSRLRDLMDELKLETGSIDMIRAKDGSYVFLEVNPGGQFMNLSKMCNYNLDKIFAEYLVAVRR